jgi:hypothetical protein
VASGTFEVVGYRDAPSRTFHVLRGGILVVSGDLFTARDGAWIAANVMSCSP